MKILPFLIYLTLFNTLGQLLAQSGVSPQGAVIGGNEIRAGISSNGLLFWTPADGPGQFFHQSQPAISNAQWAHIWAAAQVGETETQGNVALSPQQDQLDFQAGLRDQKGSHPEFNGVWLVRRADIEAHLADFADNQKIDQPRAALWSWPGYGNPHFQKYHGYSLPQDFEGPLAPFFDQNQDRIYNPEDGDYPYLPYDTENLIPEEILWTSFMTKPFSHLPYFAKNWLGTALQVQLTAFTLACSEDRLLNRTLFVDYLIHNPSDLPLDSLFLGMFMESGIGCPEDDYTGTAPEHRAFYTYNGRVEDLDCGDWAGYGNQSSSVSVQLVRGLLDAEGRDLGNHSTIAFAGDAPYTQRVANHGPAVMHNLKGHWNEGLPMTYGDNGYNPTSISTVKHLYSNRPSQTTGWSEWQENNTPGKRQVLSSTGPNHLSSGAYNRMLWAFTIHPNEYELSPAQQVDQVYEGYEESNFHDFLLAFGEPQHQGCSPIMVAQQEIPAIAAPLVSPNPADDYIQIHLAEGQEVEVELYYLSGQKILAQRLSDANQRVDLQGLKPGLYLLHLRSQGRAWTKKLMIR